MKNSFKLRLNLLRKIWLFIRHTNFCKIEKVLFLSFNFEFFAVIFANWIVEL